MPAYDICYLEDDGALACAFSVVFESEMRAKILAHAMKPTECRTLEVWQGKELIYRRPEGWSDEPLSVAHARRDGSRQQRSFV